MPNTDWKKLNNLQLGRYAEKYALMEFLSYGLNAYPSEVDDHGVDMVVKDKNGCFREIQVKSAYKGKYVFLKNEYIEDADKHKKENYYVCLILFVDGSLPKMYLLPTTAWNDTSTKLFSDRSYEFGINISEKNMPLLNNYAFEKIVEQDFLFSQSSINVSFLADIRTYLESKGLRYDDTIDKSIAARKNGKVYALPDHIRGLIYSLMTNQTEWSRVVPHLSEIDKIFFDYDVEKLKQANPSALCDELFKIKCGNRQSAAQMKVLHKNIALFEKIVQEFGSMDSFVTSAPPIKIVDMIANPKSKYKIHQLGTALAWEYLRNIGIDGAKPDTHLRRFFGSERLGGSNHNPASESEVIDTVSQLSSETGLSMAAIDNLVWSYCSDGFGEICTAKPKCDICVTKKYCNYLS